MVAIESIKGTLELFHHQLLRIAWSFPFYGLDGCVSWQSYLFAVLRMEQEQSHGRGSRPRPWEGVPSWEVLSPLCPEAAVAIIPCPPNDRPDNIQAMTGHTVFRQGGHDLAHLSFSAERGENFVGRVYVLKDGVWCMYAEFTAQPPHQTMGSKTSACGQENVHSGRPE